MGCIIMMLNLKKDLKGAQQARFKHRPVCYNRAPEAEYSQKIYNDRNLLEEGYESNPPNKVEASVWFKKAAEAGYSRAMKYYCNLLKEGFEWSPSIRIQASIWYKKAVEAGDYIVVNNYDVFPLTFQLFNSSQYLIRESSVLFHLVCSILLIVFANSLPSSQSPTIHFPITS